jgi:PBP1b-binding outer membrane lipoprotein LpoB
MKQTNMIRMKRNIIFTFIVLLLISCNNQNKTSETKQSQKDTIKNQVNNKKEEVWTIER